ncbi:MAG: response regulator [Flavobacteriales bacterium]
MIEVLLADDHALITDGISNLILDEENITIVGICRNGKDVLSYLESASPSFPNVLLLDIDMPVMNGIECAKEVLIRFPQINIGMLTMHSEKSLITEFMEMGVKGYLLKTIDKSELIKAVEKIAQGKDYFTSDVTRALLKPEKNEAPLSFNPILNELSEREKEIISLIVEGFSNKEIGEKLFISHRTVDTHRTNIMKKIDVKNVAGVVRFAFQNGLA